jgi:hypothetical protein
VSTYGEPGWTYGQLLVNYGGQAIIDILPIVPGTPFGDDELLDFLNGVRQRVDTFRFDLVDGQGNAYGQLHPIRSSQAVSIDNDTTRGIFRTMTNFNLTASEESAVDTERDFVRPVMVLQNGKEFPLGTFLFTDASRPRMSWGLELAGTLGDQGTILDQEIGRSYSIPVGSPVIASAVQVAREVLTCPIFAQAVGTTNAQPMAWKLNDTRLKIITDICTLCGFLPPYFDNTGSLILRPVPYPPVTSNIPAYEADTRIIKDSILQSEEQLRAPNRYIAYDSGTSATPVVAIFDIPASAPNSYANRGFRVTKSTGIQGLATPAAALAAATSAAYRDPDQHTQVTFESTLDPRHDTFEVVTFLGDLYREFSWSMDLQAGGHMKHSLRRIYG